MNLKSIKLALSEQSSFVHAVWIVGSLTYAVTAVLFLIHITASIFERPTPVKPFVIIGKSVGFDAGTWHYQFVDKKGMTYQFTDGPKYSVGDTL